jgi:hypothetical protein
MNQNGFLYFYVPAEGQPSEGGTFPPEVEAALRESVAPGGVSTKRALCRAPGLGKIRFDDKGLVSGMGRSITSDAWGVLGRRSEQEGLELLLNPEKQTWRVWRIFKEGAVERGTLWVGYWTDRRPGPADLARERLWPTVETARLGDGRDWLLPVLRFHGGVWAGPNQFAFSDEGEWEMEMEPRYAPIAARGERLFQTLMAVPDDRWSALEPEMQEVYPKASEVETPMDKLEIAALICDALALNYCVSGPEVAMLGLLTDATREEAQTNLLGSQTLQRFVKEHQIKKKPAAAGAAGTGSSGDGV